MRRAATALGVAGVAAAALIAATPGLATADTTLPSNLQKYANCPVDNPAVSACIFISTTSLEMKVGNWDLSTTSPVTLEFGLKFDPTTFAPTAVAPSDGHSIMTADPIEVPGGILGIPGTGVGPLAAYAQPELIGVPTVNLPAMLQGKGVALGLNLRAHVENPFTDVLSALGSGCYIGSSSDPIPLQLTTGTTTPPAPNTPITGTRGTPSVTGEPQGGIRYDGVEAVDNAFRAPGAHGCGLGLGLLDDIVDLDGGVPAAAGTNSADMQATVSEVDANTVRTAEGLPTVTQ